jgi:retron-type reverse transcriptase
LQEVQYAANVPNVLDRVIQQAILQVLEQAVEGPTLEEYPS